MKGLMWFSCLMLMLAAVLRCESEGSPLESPSNLMATIHGVVTNGGSQLSGAQVSLTGPGIARTASSRLNGTFTFTDLPPGIYALTVALPGFACESATTETEAGETVTANITCAQLVGTITGTVTRDASPVGGVVVRLLERSATTDADGVFTFDAVPAGGAYDMTVRGLGATCRSASVMVEADQTVTVNIVCEPAGDFFFYLPRQDEFGTVTHSQVGNCPPLLPAERTRRSITFDPGNGRVSIEGLDPDLTIVGDLNGTGGTGSFNGTGSAVRADGSSVHSDLTGTFGFDNFDIGFFYFFGSMTRAHRDPGGNVVCTETYWVQGNDIHLQ